MDLSAIRAGLEAWLEELTGLQVHWRKRPQNWRSQAWIKCRISSIVSIGRDSLTYREDGNDLYANQQGLRAFTLEIQFWSHSFEDDKDALHYSTIVQDSLINSWETFCEIGVGFGSVLSTRYFDREILRREVDMIQMDVLFNAEAARENPVATTWIETFEHAGDLGDAGEITGEIP
jgi:hypothetical protein